MPKHSQPSGVPTQPTLRAAPHRNQGLFSDHYLNLTLPKRADWRLYGQSAAVTDALTRVQAILHAYRPSANEAQTESGLIKPVLDALGHTIEVQASLATPGTAKKPDYVFYRDSAALEANKGKKLTEALLQGRAFAVGDAKYWERPLDVSKVSGDILTNENPASQIEFYMRYSGVSWGILTNGRLWRLYQKDSAKHLDRYYEVDLPALLADGTPEHFLYFLAFFGRRAFDAWDLGVDALLTGSNEYARTVGDSLKAQVYEALRHLAQGFLDYKPNALHPDPPMLKAIYDAALIVLYRLLFILYAEARELLPVHANRLYHESYSLDAIKREILGGKRLLAGSAMLWARLSGLFAIIDEGSAELGVPTYNGGLFDPTRHPFIARHTVGDFHLQQAIDLLARVDTQFVDYRDLAVRHLGAIYEGLLEYNLQPIEPHGGWTLDLLNDRGERKATGSYYTPDYIVSYMVEQTLGPILRDAVAAAHDEAAKARAVLAINVLDMAMGSAHFLVEATEYIARFLVGLGLSPADSQGEAELAYWKRRVAQACIYGVDLNPLAVDLAKLSLWLITVAKDRPLSFLDHHLRAGNALIGAHLATITAGTESAAPKRKARAAAIDPHQMALFAEEEFRRRMSTAVSSMWLIEESNAETVAEIKEQETLYAELRRQLTGAYGALANVLTARHFGLDVDAGSMALLASHARGESLAAPARVVGWLEAANALAERRRFFHWELEFPEVFFDRHGQPLGQAAGFDVVIGNPPYIRQEGLGTDKPYLAATFPHAYHGVADLSIYFFALALALLRPGGRTSFINSNSWLRANYATPLRAHLRASATVERLIDLGDNRIFADAPDVYPAIHVFTRAAPPPVHAAHTAVFPRGEGIRDFARQLAQKEIATTIHDQPDSGWQLGAAAGRTLFAKLMTGGRPLGEVVGGRMYRGILTGLNEAFIVDQATRDRLIQADPACAAVIKPILRGEDLRPWYQEDEGRWLIVLPSGWTAATFGAGLSEADAWTRLRGHVPAIAAHLQPFADAARKRQDKGQYWWELRSCDYYHAFEQPKLFWPDISKFPRFSWNENQALVNDKGFVVPAPAPALLGVMQSRVAWFCVTNLCVPLGERAAAIRYQQKMQFIALLPVPTMTDSEQETVGNLAKVITAAAGERYTLHRKTRHRVLTDLGSAGKPLNQKLTAWWELDFPAFRAEVHKVWKRDIPLREREDWEDLLAARRAEHARLTAAIVAAETELNARVYALFALTPEEIRMVEESTTYRYGEV